MSKNRWAKVRENYQQYLPWKNMIDTYSGVYLTQSLLRHLISQARDVADRQEVDLKVCDDTRTVQVAVALGKIVFAVRDSMLVVELDETTLQQMSIIEDRYKELEQYIEEQCTSWFDKG